MQALHDIASDGDTITLPDGAFTWSTSVRITKAITLRGNGIGGTIIRDAVQTPGFCLRVNSPAGDVNRVTGIEFRDGGRTTTTSAPNAVVKIFGNNTNHSATRVDHCKFYHLNGHIGTETAIGSVFDHCQFYFRGNTYMFSYASNYDGGSWGDKSWTAPSGFGGPNFLFVEDCLLQNDDRFFACMDAFGGARYVIRHCTLVNTHPGGHGTEGQRARGVRAVEVYGNVMTNTLGGAVGNVRAGVQIYHDNTATGPGTVGIRLQCQRIFRDFTIWGRADGTSIYDVNRNGVVLHAIDQPGRARGGLISDWNPPVLPAGWNDQVTVPCYAWNNTYDGQLTRMYGEEYNIREGEHYFNSPMPGYAPYTYPHPLVQRPTPTPTPTPTATPSQRLHRRPAAPTNLSATAVSSTQINLSWTDNSNNETGFKVERSRNGHKFNQIETVSADVTTYSATSLSPGTTYYFRVQAYNARGDSAYSNVATATTNP